MGTAQRRTAGGAHPDTVSRRLGRMLAAVLLALVAVGSAALVAVGLATNTVHELTRGYTPAAAANNSALTSMLDAQAQVRGYLLTGQPALRAAFETDAAATMPDIAEARTDLRLVSDSSLDAVIAREARLAHTWLSTYAEPIAATAHPARDRAREQAGQAAFDQFRAANARVAARLTTIQAGLTSHSADLRDAALPLIAAATVLALGVALLLGIRTARGIAEPLAALRAVVRRLDEGEPDVRADTRAGPAEVRAVAVAVNQLGASAEAAAAAEVEADRQRAALHTISSVIRSGAPRADLAAAVVEMAGPAFGVDRVWLRLLGDRSEPALTVEWHRLDQPDLGDRQPVADADIRALADALWSSGDVQAIDNIDRLDNLDGVPSLLGPVARTATELGVSALVLGALGDGLGVVGIVYLAMAGEPRSWTATDLSMVEQLSAELGHALIQNNIITQQRETVAALAAIEQERTRFVAAVSHELRTPLTSISGYVELVLEDPGGELPARARESLQVVARNAVRLGKLIDNLVAQPRVDGGAGRPSIGRCDICSVLDAVTATMTPLAANAEVRLQVAAVAAGELPVAGDARQLEQAVTNLVANAVKFTPARGHVDVRAYRDRAAATEQVVIEVADTGIGVPADELPHLHDRFFRASNAVRAAIPGTGLGLAIVGEIVAQHGGTTRVDSRLNQGTVVTIRLPAASPS
jgi:signal transduction histidine kinase/CHASE3 domain sensor protein